MHWVAYVFGGFLVLTGLRVARKREHGSALGESKVLLLLQRRLPVTPDFDGARFWTRVDGRRMATPLAAALLAIAVFDVLFAVDSIPAVLAITTEPFIVFAANAFALLGLRSLFFLVIGSLTRIRYLNAGLGAILVLVGTKMLIADWWKVPIWVSLPAIVGILAVTVLLSLRATPPARRPAPRPLAPEGGR